VAPAPVPQPAAACPPSDDSAVTTAASAATLGVPAALLTIFTTIYVLA